MIRKLQFKFVSISTLAVFVVITAAIGLLNTYNIQQTNVREEMILDVLVENQGSLRDLTGGSHSEEFKEVLERFGSEYQYQIRYFVVTLDEEYSVSDLDTDNITSITDDEVMTILGLIKDNGKYEKFQKVIYDGNTYAYKVVETADGYTIAVYDCTFQDASNSAVLQKSIQFGIICMGFFVIVVSLFSKRALRSFIRNMESQKQFITNAGHELKTPLTVISANVDVIEMIDGESEWTTSIKNQIGRMTGLINRLIRMARVGEGEDLVLTDVDFSEIAKDAAKGFRAVAQAAGKTLITEIEEGVTTHANQDILYEVTSVLLDNACKYCDDGGTIAMELKKERKAKLTVVNDYADGKNVDYERFFERFYREDSSHSKEATSKGGYGIGLSMAQECMQAMKGNITVSYKDGKIAFTVTI